MDDIYDIQFIDNTAEEGREARRQVQAIIDAKDAQIAALEKFRADILAAAALNVNVVAKMEYIQMVIDEQKGA